MLMDIELPPRGYRFPEATPLPRTPAHADLTIRSRGVCSILHSGYAPNLLRSRYFRIKYQGPSMQSVPIRPYNLTGVAIMNTLNTAVSRVAESLDQVAQLNARYRAGEVHAYVPEALRESERSLEKLIEKHLPASHAALEAASRALFFSLPVAFNPAESVGPYLAVIDRDAAGQPYRFLDMGALLATNAFGENDPAVVRAVLESLPFVTSRYAHSEYQTALSLRLKAELNRIAPAGTPRHFIVNTGAEAVENAIKSVLLNRVMTSPDGDGGFIVSFEGAFHGRTLGCLAVTHRKKARLGFPTFDWPHIPFPVEEAGSPKETARREEPSLRQLWALLVSGRIPRAEKSRDTYRREMDAVDEFLAQPGGDLSAFVQAQRASLSSEVVRRSQRVAAVLVEPIQGEGGVRMASARFMRKLRLLTRIYDVPLVFDEVQTGWGMTGRLWAHELFDLPCPPDVVTWAKKAQNGVLFVSEELATFFQEEKKFNTTWEGDSVGIVRLLALLDKLGILLDTGEIVDLAPGGFEAHKLQILGVEQERYGGTGHYRPGVRRTGRRPLLQFPLETLESTASNPRAIGIALRDRVSARLVGYALGSALENHDEEGVRSDPRCGENNTFYLHAMAVLPTVQNCVEIENVLLESLRTRAIAAEFEFLSTLIEDRLRETGPARFHSAAILLQIDNYLGSGSCFAYLQAALQPAADPSPRAQTNT